MIKLYEVNYSYDYHKTRIEFVQDIIFNENNDKENKNNTFKGFREAVSCIIQSSKDGKILISCWDGKIYLFEINFDDLLKNKKKNDLFKELFIN